jgi:hypothetical protein
MRRRWRPRASPGSGAADGRTWRRRLATRARPRARARSRHRAPARARRRVRDGRALRPAADRRASFRDHSRGHRRLRRGAGRIDPGRCRLADPRLGVEPPRRPAGRGPGRRARLPRRGRGAGRARSAPRPGGPRADPAIRDAVGGPRQWTGLRPPPARRRRMTAARAPGATARRARRPGDMTSRLWDEYVIRRTTTQTFGRCRCDGANVMIRSRHLPMATQGSDRWTRSGP